MLAFEVNASFEIDLDEELEEISHNVEGVFRRLHGSGRSLDSGNGALECRNERFGGLVCGSVEGGLLDFGGGPSFVALKR